MRLDSADSEIGRLAGQATGANLSGTRTDIEGLRAVAILLVVAYHARVPGFAGGFTGVDVFFVLSGYLITGLLLRELGRTGRIGLMRFYGRRARRLLPAAGLVLMVTLAVGRVVLSPLEMKSIAGTGVATAFYASNFYFIRQATDYLGGAGHANPLLHTWSLAVEEQFYLLWPVLLLAGAGLVRRARAANRLPLLLALVAALSFVMCLRLTQTIQPWAFFGSPPRAWEFAAGGLAAFLPATRLVRGSVATVGGWAGLALIGAGAVLIGPDTPFPGWVALAPVAGTVIVLVSCASDQSRGVGRLLGVAPLQTTGRLSYSWYLWHWPVLVFAQMLGYGAGLPAGLALMMGSLGISALAYRFFENPIRHSIHLAPRPALTLVLALGLTMSLGGASWGARLGATRTLALPEQIAFATALDEPSVPAGCHLGYFEVDARTCAFGDTTASRLIVLFGDSHAAQWVPALDVAGRTYGWQVRLLTKGDCPAPLVDVQSPRLQRAYTECSQWRRSVIDRMAQWRPAVVIATSSTLYPLSPERFGVTLEDWRAGWSGTVETLQRTGARVVVLRDTPRPGFDVPECLSRKAYSPFGRANDCEVRRAAAVDTTVYELQRSVATGRPDVVLLDLTAEFCDDAGCPTVLDGTVVYRDSHHISAAFSRSLHNSFLAVLADDAEATRTSVRAARPPD